MPAAPRIADADTARAPSTAITETLIAGVPWYLWCAALAVTSAYVGGYWDIAWHRSIGRDSFLSAPHLAIYACGVFAGITAGYLILTTTFGGADEDVSVRIWDSRDRLRVHLRVGVVAMLASAPFDDGGTTRMSSTCASSARRTWCSRRIFVIDSGTVMLMLAFMNRAAHRCVPRSSECFCTRRHGAVRMLC